MAAKNPRWPSRNLVFWHFNIRPRWFPAHHRDRLVLCYVYSFLSNFFYSFFPVSICSVTEKCYYLCRNLNVWRNIFAFLTLHWLLVVNRKIYIYIILVFHNYTSNLQMILKKTRKWGNKLSQSCVWTFKKTMFRLLHEQYYFFIWKV